MAKLPNLSTPTTNNSDDKALVTTNVITGKETGEILGYDPLEFYALGFSEQRIVKIGDPANGGIGAYIGELMGPGPDVQVAVPGAAEGEVGFMKSWLVRPLNVKTLQPNAQISDQVICPYSLNQAFERIFQTAERIGKRAVAGAAWDGKVSIQAGRRMVNKYRIFERYLDKGEEVRPVVDTTAS